MILRQLRQRLAVFFLLFAVLGLASASASSPPPSDVRAKEGQPGYIPHPAEGLDCRPFGECEPCPKDDHDEPFCQPFGNRRLLHCVRPDDPEKHEVPAWEACGKVIKLEQREFNEFVTGNLLLLLVCLAIYAVRTSALATQQYRQLAARIGIPSGSWRA